MQARHVCTILTEITVSHTLIQTVASGLDGCDSVKVLSLCTVSTGRGADSYIGMMRHDIDAIVEGLDVRQVEGKLVEV
jgi:ABC-type Zn uptake system ZnuABC Zn-binding protein ZnuA